MTQDKNICSKCPRFEAQRFNRPDGMLKGTYEIYWCNSSAEKRSGSIRLFNGYIDLPKDCSLKMEYLVLKQK